MRITLFNTALVVNILLAFLLAFESYIQVPLWLQVFGRMHPLFLHIPIGILVLYALLELFSAFEKSRVAIDFKDLLLLIGSVSVSVTALMGLFLGREEGYEAEAVVLHKWAGAITSFLLLAWYQWRAFIRRHVILDKAVAILSIVIITVTGHFGGNITHGENFVIAPVTDGKRDIRQVSFDEAIVYTDLVNPIIQEKCVSCHNDRKAKGELIMETAEMLMKGGKNGKLWDTASENLGLMLSRIHLPLDHDDHMPPKGKPQLTETEKAILEAWIKGGSNFTISVVDLERDDTLRMLAELQFKKAGDEQYTFKKADDKLVRQLNNFYRVVKPLAENSPALSVIFFEPSKFDPQGIKQLKPIETQVVQVDLSRMPVGDSALRDIGQFSNLRKLNLSFTKIKGDGLHHLNNLQHLQELSLSGTRVDASSLRVLSGFPSLKKVYLWNTSISDEQLAALATKKSDVQYETGFDGDTLMLKLTPPVVENDRFVLSEPVNLLLKHNINGAQIRYTLDGSEPDSVKSPLYDKKVVIDDDVTVKTKVFRDGWISSDTRTIRFYRSTVQPVDMQLLTNPDRFHKARGVKTLFDNELAGIPRVGSTWLGYQYPDKLNVVIDLGKEIKEGIVSLSVVTEPDAHVFAPESITIWYGSDRNNLTRKATMRPSPPVKDEKPKNQAYSLKFSGNAVRYIRLEAVPMKRIPYWKSEKREPGWIFADEIIIK